MVTSTGSGLAVPDWPLSYGSLFPPMVGGVFYEHGHRMTAAGVGLLTLCLSIWLGVKEKRGWVRYLGFGALAAVVAQGILGGLTVLFFLPTAISVSHALLAQSFFIITILIAYSQSKEREARDEISNGVNPKALKLSFLFAVLVYMQLLLGALMRHMNSDPFVSHLFFTHLLGASAIALCLCILNISCMKNYKEERRILSTLSLLDMLFLTQLALGLLTVLTRKSPTVTSFHVATGAAVLGVSVLLVLRMAPLSLGETRKFLFQ